MKKACMTPPDCCVIIEMEKGVTLGYRKAVLLNEIEALGSLTKAARVSKIDQEHALDLIQEMNESFSEPLVCFPHNAPFPDHVALTEKGMVTVKQYWRKFEPAWFSIIQERARHY
ncbi:LysR family transcriptional regulator [Desulfobulbus rhabdoformis]|uniref:winged helix-turn-helix domain-containing protein n=1 Tax=Desulfobulbus rhabdoformis TaxID=34032 RepID=UPI001965881D|nr:LysR family transcriptional regulator [Desulfobulbus rhabdoformis]MBM9615543.1 LysR family transcriptional regulator [Desulfobulbus rhabdoformis]